MGIHPRTRLTTLTTLVVSTVVGVLATLVSPAGAAAGFGDVEADRFYTDAVQWMVGEQITDGIEFGCFGPELDVTRGQVATFLYRLDASEGNNPTSSGHPFADVVASYQQVPVGWLFGAGLTTGTSPTTFDPNASITRGDFAVLLWRYAGEPAAARPHDFGDVTKAYQQSAIAWMDETEITTGKSPTRFDPDGAVTRAEAATFLFRFVDPVDIAPASVDTPCTRDLRIALEDAGLTSTESRCAVPFLLDFDVDYLIAVAEDRAVASIELIFAAAAVGGECLTPTRIADLSRIFL